VQTLDAETRAALIDEIDFALRLRARLPGRWKDEFASRSAAQAILDQLLRANWRLERGEPLALHSTPRASSDPTN
jgi:hypothetical protein